jgi:hypothetical protein
LNWKPLLTAIFIFGLIGSTVAGMHTFEVAEANWAIPPDNVAITIQSPQNITYNTNEIPLNFTVERNVWHHTSYVLDDAVHVVTEFTTNFSVPVQDPGGLSYKRWTGQLNAVLSNLSDGFHTLIVREYVVYDWEPVHVVSSANVSFTVDTQSGASANISPTPPVNPSPTPTTTPDAFPTRPPTQQPTPEPTQTGSIDLWSIVPNEHGPFPLLEII